MPNQLHDSVFSFLENYRKEFPEFYYWLRGRNNKNRLVDGFWFQGNNRYAFVGLYNRGGGSNMTRSVGLVFYYTGDVIGCYVEIVFNEEKDENILHFYHEAMQQLEGFEKQHETKFKKALSSINGFEAARDFLNNVKPQLDHLLINLNLGQLFITRDQFLEKLDNVNAYRIPPNGQANQNIQMMPLQRTYPLNQILYGPPGTGKTYYTVKKAVLIANPAFKVDGKSRHEIKAEYDRLKAEGQIEFITFHQSMTYEDFIEGIKPIKVEGETFLNYQVQSGIFKLMVKRASYSENRSTVRFSLEQSQFDQASFYKINLMNPNQPDKEEAYKYCIDNNCIMTGWVDSVNFAERTETDINKMMKDGLLPDGSASILNAFIHYLKTGDYMLLARAGKVVAIGKVSSTYYFDPNGFKGYNHYRGVEWLVSNASIPALEIYDREFGPKSIYRLDKEEIKKDFFVKSAVDIQPTEIRKNYVLIIDEINRGNVSAIFGELITLIEEDKRKGAPEALEVMLPYSKDKFSVPSNLYLIGTMNTADRSVEALDTALRRRFVFEEMSPIPNLLSPQRMMYNFWWAYELEQWNDDRFYKVQAELFELLGLPTEFPNEDIIWNQMKDGPDINHIALFDDAPFTGVDLEKLLTTINKRLQVLLTKDHTIGHAWLMNVASLSDLRLAFKNRILPLLQEYFYNNYEKIGLVLGSAFLEEKSAKGIFAKDFKGTNDLQSDYDDKVMYSLKDPFTLTREDFIKIYA